MNKINKGLIIIIVAPSGSGKSTLLKMIFEKYRKLSWSISTTSRKIRPKEVHGKDYFFTTTANFKREIEANRFVEWAEVHGNYYGTSKDFINHALQTGEFVVCDLDVQGTDEMLKLYPDDARAIFIEPPSLEVLEQRLRDRGTETEDTIFRRITNAKSELKRKNDYHYLVQNDSLEDAYKHLEKIVKDLIENKKTGA